MQNRIQFPGNRSRPDHGIMTIRACVLASFFLLAAPAVPIALAEDVGDPTAGRAVAEAWCSSCHAYPGATRAIATGAPSFSAVAANKAITPLSLRAFLQTPHERMPDLHLSNNEMDDLIAFILSARGK